MRRPLLPVYWKMFRRKIVRGFVTGFPYIKRRSILFAAIGALIICASLIYGYWNALAYPRGWLRENGASIFQTLASAASLGLGFMPRLAATLEINRRYFRVTLVCIGSLLAVGTILNIKDKEESSRQSRAVIASLRNQATVQDMQALRLDFNGLKADTKSGFEDVIAAINLLRVSTKPAAIKPPQTAPSTSVQPNTQAAQKPIDLGPGSVQHIQASQRRTSSPKDEFPFAVQAIIQTDVASQPTAFMIECDGEIADGDFFLAGQPVTMGKGIGIQPDKKRFYLRFEYPSFTPESPIVVTLLSKSDIRVVRVMRTN